MKDLAPLPTKNPLVEEIVAAILSQPLKDTHAISHDIEDGKEINFENVPKTSYEFVVLEPDFTKPHDLYNLNRVQIWAKPRPVVTEISGSPDGTITLKSDTYIPAVPFKIERAIAISNIPSVLDLPLLEGEEPKQEVAITISFETLSANPGFEFSKSVSRHYISSEAMAKKAIHVTYRNRDTLVKDVMDFLNDGIKPPQS